MRHPPQFYDCGGSLQQEFELKHKLHSRIDRVTLRNLLYLQRNSRRMLGRRRTGNSDRVRSRGGSRGMCSGSRGSHIASPALRQRQNRDDKNAGQHRAKKRSPALAGKSIASDRNAGERKPHCVERPAAAQSRVLQSGCRRHGRDRQGRSCSGASRCHRVRSERACGKIRQSGTTQGNRRIKSILWLHGNRVGSGFSCCNRECGRRCRQRVVRNYQASGAGMRRRCRGSCNGEGTGRRRSSRCRGQRKGRGSRGPAGVYRGRAECAGSTRRQSAASQRDI